MTNNITFIWGDDEAGIWDGDIQVAGMLELRRAGYEVNYFLSMTQSQLEKFARRWSNA